MDDETIEQAVRQEGQLTEEQIEAVREAIREAAEQGEELLFLEAAVRKELLTEEPAATIRKEAELQVSTSETEDISEVMPGGADRAELEEAAPDAEMDQPSEADEPEEGEEIEE